MRRNLDGLEGTTRMAGRVSGIGLAIGLAALVGSRSTAGAQTPGQGRGVATLQCVKRRHAMPWLVPLLRRLLRPQRRPVELLAARREGVSAMSTEAKAH